MGDPERDAEVPPPRPGDRDLDAAQPSPGQAVPPPHLVSPAIDTEHVVMDALRTGVGDIFVKH